VLINPSKGGLHFDLDRRVAICRATVCRLSPFGRAGKRKSEVSDLQLLELPLLGEHRFGINLVSF
jgi:hypothetical protein